MGPKGLVSISLEGLEAYATHLHKSLRDEELVTQALASLLEHAVGLEASDLGEVVGWCLEDADTLLRSGAPGSALRLLILERRLAVSSTNDPACEELLAAAPAILCSAGPEQLAAVQRLAAAAALALPGGAQAAEWLRPLRRDADFAVYAAVAAAVLARHQDMALQADAWEAATSVMTGPNAAERRACTRHLLPALVAESAAGPAGLHEVAMALLRGRGQSRAEVADALTLTVSFHEVLLARWRLASPDGDHEPLAVELVLAGLRSGLKEASSCRKSARFLLETAVRAFLADPRTPECLEALGVSESELAGAWRSFWELSDGLEASSSHLLKASWEPSIAQIRSFLEKMPGSADGLPACVLSQRWLEALLCRALGHSNDSVSKFVLARLLEPQRPRSEVVAKGRPLLLSKDFVVGEILPRLNRGIDALYPKGDINQRFENQVQDFFASFIDHSSCGPQVAARALLLAIFDNKPMHHTPLRLILWALAEARGARGAIGPEEAVRLITLTYTSIVDKLPVSTRAFLSTLLMEAIAALAGAVDGEGEGELVASSANALAAIPDSLVREGDFRRGVCALLRRLLGGREAGLLSELLRGLVSPRRDDREPASPASSRRSAFECGADATPMEAVQLTLGIVRAFWAIDYEEHLFGMHAAAPPRPRTPRGRPSAAAAAPPAERPADESLAAASAAQGVASPAVARPPPEGLQVGATTLASSTTNAATPSSNELRSDKSCLKYVMPVLSGGLRAPSWSDPLGSLPRRAIAATLFGAAYSAALLEEGPAAWEAEKDAVDRLLEFACKSAAALLRRDCREYGEEKEELPWAWLYALALERFLKPDLPEARELMKQLNARRRLDNSAQGAISMVFLGPLCLKEFDSERRLGFVRRLMRPPPETAEEEDSGIVEELLVTSGCGALGSWSRSRAEEYGDLRRPELEGVGRVCERRDLREVHSTAKWRCLAAASRDASLMGALIAGDDDSCDGWTSWQLAQGLLDDFSALQPADMARWAALARNFALRVLLDADRPEEEQRGALERLCAEISGALAGMAGGSVQVPPGCMQELAAALCDPRMWQAECRLCQDLPLHAKPLSSALLRLLHLGETSPGPSRCLVVSLLAALLRPARPTVPQPEADGAAAELLLALLLHKEGTIADGVWCHAPFVGDLPLGEDGQSSRHALESPSPGTPDLVDKFHFTACLCRVLTLAGLDALADRSDRKEEGLAQLIRCVVRALLARMRKTIEQLQRPGGGKTPMPQSEQHCAQLRGWQALLVLGGRADREMAAEMLPEVFFHLSVPHVPDVRDYQELLACALCSRYEDLVVESLLLPALREFDAPIQVSASLLVVAAYLLRCWVDRPREGPSEGVAEVLPPHLGDVVCACLPYAGHNSAYVRGVAAWGLFHALQALGPDGLEKHFPSGAVATLAEMHRFLATNRRCGNIRDRLQPVFMAFDPSQRCLLSCLLDRSLVLSSAQDDDEVAEHLHTYSNGDFHPTALFLDTIKKEVAHEMQAAAERADPTTYPSSSDEWRARHAAARATSEVLREAEAAFPEKDCVAERAAVGLQRKFEPQGMPTGAELAGQAAEEQTARSELVVVASLVDIPANLAGLCRTCEVLGCRSLWLANAQVTKDSAFQTISVKSEKWLPIEEVPRSALREKLRRMRQRGFAIIGVEQTHDSVQLDEYRFPAKTVLVLGNEKAGIDAWLLPCLDECVEIPQTGQLRSLNVHASGVVAVWEYVRQQRSFASGRRTLPVDSVQ